MAFIDITVGDDGKPKNKAKASKREPKKFLGVRFECANNAYTRFYPNPERTAYKGRCPLCMKEVRIRIGMDGTSSRFFKYNCNQR